jgi:hypothetical protein
MEGLHLDEASRSMKLLGKARSAMLKYDPTLADGYSADSLALRERLLKKPA